MKIDRQKLRNACVSKGKVLNELLSLVGAEPLILALLDQYDALLPYVDHAADCKKGKMYNSFGPPEECTCGLDALLTA